MNQAILLPFSSSHDSRWPIRAVGHPGLPGPVALRGLGFPRAQSLMGERWQPSCPTYPGKFTVLRSGELIIERAEVRDPIC